MKEVLQQRGNLQPSKFGRTQTKTNKTLTHVQLAGERASHPSVRPSVRLCVCL